MKNIWYLSEIDDVVLIMSIFSIISKKKISTNNFLVAN